MDTVRQLNLNYSLEYGKDVKILGEIDINLRKSILLEQLELKKGASAVLIDMPQVEAQLELLKIDFSAYPVSTLAEILTKFPDDKENMEQIIDLQNEVINAKYILNDYQNMINAYRKELADKGLFVNPLWGKTNAELAKIATEMSVAEQAAQLLIWSFPGIDLTDIEGKQLTEQLPGGVILMGDNISSASQLKHLSLDVQGTNPKIPLFIVTDQEGGVVKRVKWDSTAGEKFWANMSDAQICQEAQKRSQILLDGGINVNLAPVVDLTYSAGGFINNRTISADNNLVTQKARQFINCSQQMGIITTLKHFPGHGATGQDSHTTLPVINKSKSDWLKSDAIPFVELSSAKMIMAGHLWFKDIDPVNSTTQSKDILTGILRQELGYKGLIITDDMNQLHVSTKISVHDALKGAYQAGVDMVLYVGLPKSKAEIVNEIEGLITSGELSQPDLNSKLMRILIAKRSIYAPAS